VGRRWRGKSARSAGQITAGMAASHRPPNAARLPWVKSAIRDDTPAHTPELRGRHPPAKGEVR
jgi:hypothetical protein